jgi:hypothetical protein
LIDEQHINGNAFLTMTKLDIIACGILFGLLALTVSATRFK